MSFLVRPPRSLSAVNRRNRRYFARDVIRDVIRDVPPDLIRDVIRDVPRDLIRDVPGRRCRP